MTAVTEHRRWTVTCRRKIVAECHRTGELESDVDVRSTAQAEQAFRDAGWTLHGDDTATCPICNAVWTGELAVGRLAALDPEQSATVCAFHGPLPDGVHVCPKCDELDGSNLAEESDDE